MSKLVKLVRLNGLQFNANRDPQVYRRVVGEPFRIQALLDAGAAVRCTLRDVRGQVIASADVPGGGTFTHNVKFDAPGVHVVTLSAERGGDSFTQDLRLDVLAHAWTG
ncbi:MAG TPA: hypothetical protein VLD36_10235 [Burkholderiales bacterium]|nr:hypothetical protein [Burkholderiales bacterium]